MNWEELKHIYIGVLKDGFRVLYKDGTYGFVSYHSTGEVECEAWYKNCKLNGQTTHWFCDGKIRKEITYFDGMIKGKYTERDENGNIICEYNW